MFYTYVYIYIYIEREIYIQRDIYLSRFKAPESGSTSADRISGNRLQYIAIISNSYYF